MMVRTILLSVLLAATSLGAGCATTKDEDISSMPWNRPQSWEGTGALGGFRPPGQGF